MKKQRITLKITRLLLITDTLIWFSFSLITAFGFHPAIPEGALYRWGTAALAFLTSLGLAGLYYLLIRKVKFAYYLLLGGLFIISLLSITDQFGIYDLIVLIINLGILILLLRDRKVYLE